ncbi:PadR family transcriptional regulator [candidate division KSB1 bacterium]
MELLTKLEELILLSVWNLKENAYGSTIFKHISEVTGKKLSLGGVYFPLERLTKKDYLNSFTGESNQERRGLSKRYYKLTEKGIAALNELNKVNSEMWKDYPGFSFSAEEN